MRRKYKLQCIRHFYHQSKTCCRCIERLDMNRRKTIKELNISLARLYADALQLPNPHVYHPDAGHTVRHHGHPWTFRDCYFWSVMNPFDETSLCQGSFKDALEGIEKDLEDGILLYESGDSLAAATLWFNLFKHWSAHLMETLAFLHTVIVEV